MKRLLLITVLVILPACSRSPVSPTATPPPPTPTPTPAPTPAPSSGPFTLAGIVTLDGVRPIGSTLVDVKVQGSFSASATTDGNGYFSIAGVPTSSFVMATLIVPSHGVFLKRIPALTADTLIRFSVQQPGE